MGPARFTILETFDVRCEAFVLEADLRNIFILAEIEDEPGVGPFLFIRIPGHIAIGYQPNHSLAGDQFFDGKIEEGVHGHIYRELIVLLFGAAGKGYAPPAGDIADPFDRLFGADPGGDAAVKIVVSHFVCFLYKARAAGARSIVRMRTQLRKFRVLSSFILFWSSVGVVPVNRLNALRKWDWS